MTLYIPENLLPALMVGMGAIAAFLLWCWLLGAFWLRVFHNPVPLISNDAPTWERMATGFLVTAVGGSLLLLLVMSAYALGDAILGAKHV